MAYTGRVSTAPVALANLITAITAQPQAVSQLGFAFGLVRGTPLANAPLDDAIVIRKITRTVTRLAMVGPVDNFGAFREDFIIPVEVFSFRGGDDAVTVENRAWSLVGAVETAVRSDPTLAGAVLAAFPEFNEMVSDWDPDSSGRRASTVLDIHCWSEL